MAARRPALAPDELDELTLRRAQRRDPAAWKALVVRYERRVFALVSRMLGSARRAQVEDLAQDTFLQVFRGLDGFTAQGPARLSTWILTIATRRAIDELRRREPRLVVQDTPDRSSERADDAIRRGEIGAAIERAVGGLAPEYRAAFLLREYHGLDYAEIAAALGVDLGTVKSRLSRARAGLRAALAEIAEP